MDRKEKARLNLFLRYLLLIGLGIVMIYPLCWMIGASFKTNSELFSSTGATPIALVLDGYRNGSKGYEGMNLLYFVGNTYRLISLRTVFTVMSTVITSYGFAKFWFAGKNLPFVLLLSTLFLPQVVLNVLQYILFNEVGWLNSYLPIVILSILAGNTLSVHMPIQFLGGIPRGLEEATEVGGCNVVERLWCVIVPMPKPSIVSCTLFQFMWASDDFMGPLIYINSIRRHPVSIFLRMSMDTEAGFDWSRTLAMSLLAITPFLAVLLMVWDSFIDGITVGGVKG